MATTNVYRKVKDTFDGKESYNIYATSGINQGDMCQWDPTALVATNNTLGSGSIFLGVAEDANPLAGLGTPTVNLTGNKCRIQSEGVHFFKTTTGETYVHLTPVYQGADQQTVSTVGATVFIGRCWLPDGSTVTGAAGTPVNVLIVGSQTKNSCIPSSATAAR